MKAYLNQEELFRFIQNKKWNDFLTVLQRCKEEIDSSQVAQNAENIFIDEFIKDAKTREPELFLNEYEKIIILNVGRYFVLAEDKLRVILELNISGLSKIDPSKAYKFAKNWIDYDFAANYCYNYELSQPEIVKHSYEDKVSVTHNKLIRNNDFTIPLFKSNREFNFYKAVKECFPNFYIYPNVALSCIIDFNKISEELSPNQGKYFYKSVVDCAVFDPDNNYKPKYFFEIDSEYHDEPRIKNNDKWKDLFFSLAGHKLYRVRPTSNRIDQEMFYEIIKDIFETK